MEALLKVTNICKQFGATKALSDVSMELYPGEVRELLGENGSGKSTLSNIIAGIYEQSSGQMFFQNEPYCPKSVLDSSRKGISLLAQETGTIAGMTVCENMFLGEETQNSRWGLVNFRRLCQSTAEILKRHGLEHINPEENVERYSFEDRKMLEVARAVHHSPQILIIDETTTALSHHGRQKIYEIVSEMRAQRKSVIFISHDLDEIMQVCDSATILRDGHYIETLGKEQMNKDAIRALMIGREFDGSYYRPDWEGHFEEEVVLKAENICCAGSLHDVSLELHKGEILGIGGLTESGMHELCKVLFGAIHPDSGSVTYQDGTKITSPQEALKKHIAYIPKDRDTESLFITANIRDNIVASSYDTLQKGGFIRQKSEDELAERYAGSLQVKMSGVRQHVSELSGGNKQKVALCKWLANDSQIFLMDCPTRGIDVGVKANIYLLMQSLKQQGKAIIMVSEELTELIGMSDRIIILKNGMCTGEFMRQEKPTEQAIIQKML